MERVSKINIVRSKKENLSDEEQTIILNDFYNSLTFSYKFGERIPDLVYLYEQVELVLESRVYANFEDEYRRETKGAIANIIRDNNEYEKELTKMIQEMESKSHISFVDHVFISGAKSAIASKDKAVTEGAFSVSDVRAKADTNIRILKKHIFNTIQAYGINLGTKKESKADTNRRIAKTMYEIICKGEIRKEFDDYCMLRKKEQDLSPELQLLIKHIGIDGVSKISSMCRKRNFVTESLLLMYVVLSDAYRYDPLLLESYIDEPILKQIQDTAESNVDAARDQLCLRYRITV